MEAVVSPLLEAPLGSMESAAPSSTSRRRHRVERSESLTLVRYRQETTRRRGILIKIDSDEEEITTSNREEQTASKLLGENKSEEWKNYKDFFNRKVPFT